MIVFLATGFNVMFSFILKIYSIARRLARTARALFVQPEDNLRVDSKYSFRI